MKQGMRIFTHQVFLSHIRLIPLACNFLFGGISNDYDVLKNFVNRLMYLSLLQIDYLIRLLSTSKWLEIRLKWSTKNLSKTPTISARGLAYISMHKNIVGNSNDVCPKLNSLFIFMDGTFIYSTL